MIGRDEPKDVREFIGHAFITKNLAEDPTGEIRDVHRVAAAAASDARISSWRSNRNAGVPVGLFTALWRLKFASDPRAYKVALQGLARRAASELKNVRLQKHGKPNRILFRACAQALREWLATSCTRCGGTGHWLLRGRLLVACSKCGGEGSRGWTTQQRAVALGLDIEVFTRSKWEERLQKIVSILTGLDISMEDETNRQLGRRRKRAA